MNDRRAGPFPRLDYSRHYELPGEPSEEFRVRLNHLLRRLSRAHGADREPIDLEIDLLVVAERERLYRTTARPVRTPTKSGRPAWTEELFWRRLEEAKTKTERPHTTGSLRRTSVVLMMRLG